MGTIRDLSSGKVQLLELPEHGIGRAPSSSLCLPERYVSAQHAVIRWNGSQWELRDLGSRNGTFLDGNRLKPSEEYPLRVGSRMAFGHVADAWELADDAAPDVMAVPLDGSQPVLLDGDLLVLPSNDDPRVTIYRDANGAWVLEQPNELILPIGNLQTFEVDRRTWRFCCNENVRTTSLGLPPEELEVRRIQLSFLVSRDEEHVQLHMTCGASSFDMGARSHNYLLLTLARRRLADAADRIDEASCGWIHQDDIAHDPTMAPPQLNIDVCRIRKQFAAVGIVDAANIIERRPRARQLRIGTGILSVTQL
jgi:hypothetical protein